MNESNEINLNMRAIPNRWLACRTQHEFQCAKGKLSGGARLKPCLQQGPEKHRAGYTGNRKFRSVEGVATVHPDGGTRAAKAPEP
jgi:hypothetical protein